MAACLRICLATVLFIGSLGFSVGVNRLFREAAAIAGQVVGPEGQMGIYLVLLTGFVCLSVLSFAPGDWFLAGLVAIASMHYLLRYESSVSPPNALTFLSAVVIGKAVALLSRGQRSTVVMILCLLLAACVFWQLDKSRFFYHGPRWTGIWNDPNRFGLLMGAGCVLAAGVSGELQPRCRGPWILVRVCLLIGLLCSFSRGAWVATAVGWMFAGPRGQFRMPGRAVVISCVVGASILLALCWRADSDRWYFARLDLSRGSVQHRLHAWKCAADLAFRNPLGLGWNRGEDAYTSDYLAPAGQASDSAAFSTNDYAVLAVEAGLPALLCFLCFAGAAAVRHRGSVDAGIRGGAILFLCGMMFDSVLFDVATATLFWFLVASCLDDNHEALKTKTGLA
ncbi:MAG: O-antigen ligase family protein [Verrucomicrobiota bacterium]